MCRAIVLERSEKHDVTAASKYGEIIILLPNASYGDPWRFDYGREVLEACEKMNFDSKKDMIIISGPMMGLCIGVASLIAQYGEVNALFWDWRYRQFQKMCIGKKLEAA